MNIFFFSLKIPKSYKFGYSVGDPYSGDTFSHHETKTDYSTEGEYRVVLPDSHQVTTIFLYSKLTEMKKAESFC